MSESMPIDDVRAAVESHLRADPRPLLVVAPTGSGKSTRLPLWMTAVLGGPVLVVEPRRVACRSLAAWVAQGLGEQPGRRVGWRVRFEDVSSPATRVLFVTPGVALRMLRDRALQGWAGVLVDEVHERGWEVDLVVALLRRLRAAGGPALALASATVDVPALQAALGAHVVRSEGRAWPVDVSYAGGVQLPSWDRLAERVAGAVEQALGASEGEILVFLPGKGEIAACADALAPAARRFGVEVVPVHGSLPAERLARAFRPHGERRRVFLSTNVAETSVTLPGVTVVVDAGLVRMRAHRAGRSALLLRPTSQASMDQRAGRAGRVAPGRCVRLWDERYRPEPETPPEIERIELDDMVLQAAACGLAGDSLTAAPWVSQPPAFALERARAWLLRLGALDGAGELTPLGLRLAALPVSGDEGRLLVDPPPGLAGTLADLVALMQSGGRLIADLGGRPAQVREDVELAREELLAGHTDEVLASLACLRGGDAARHGLHRSGLAEARRGATQLRELLGVSPADPTRDREPLPSREALARALLRRIPDAAFLPRERVARKGPSRDGAAPWGNGQEEVTVHPWRPPARGEAPPEAGLVLETAWIGDDRAHRVRGVGRLVLPCRRVWLREEGLGEAVVAEPRIEGPRGGGPGRRVVAAVETVYAGVTLGTEERELHGAELCAAVARLVLQGRLLRDAGERLRDDVHLWNLLIPWPDPLGDGRDRPGPITDEAAWLTARLADLGLQESADLALLEPRDLRPDLEAAFGASAAELEAIGAELPRVWELNGARYTCAVQPRARLVILEPANKEAARARDPEAFHLPRFQRFGVVYRRASRQVKIR